MKLTSTLKVGLALLLCAGAAHAQMYKWKDAKGVTHFSDIPPPPSVANAEMKSYAGGEATVELPFELAEAVKNHPVTLYTAPQCSACDRGRVLLLARGIPYTEKTVTTAADQAALKQAGSDNQLPLLLVGRAKHTGFEQAAWEGALSAYPAQKMLPANYHHRAPVAAAPRAAEKKAPAPVEAPPEKLLPVNAPPDFQF